MDDLYRENILDHYRHPRFKGKLEPHTHRHHEHNPVCGDELQVDLLVNNDGIVEQAAFSGHGCAISQASASMLMERIQGKPLEEVKKISKEDILEDLGIPIGPVRLKCALLSLKALKGSIYGLSAIENFDEDDDDW
jgi:nitrogen fixation NifU-like protein